MSKNLVNLWLQWLGWQVRQNSIDLAPYVLVIWVVYTLGLKLTKNVLMSALFDCFHFFGVGNDMNYLLTLKVSFELEDIISHHCPNNFPICYLYAKHTKTCMNIGFE